LAAVEAALDVGEGAQVGLRAAGGQAGAALADAPGEGVAFVAASELHLPVGPGALDGIAQQEDEPDAGMVASDPLGGVRPEAVGGGGLADDVVPAAGREPRVIGAVVGGGPVDAGLVVEEVQLLRFGHGEGRLV